MCHLPRHLVTTLSRTVRNSQFTSGYEQLESSSRSPARCSRLTLLSVLKLVLRAGYCICSERERAARRIRNTYFFIAQMSHMSLRLIRNIFGIFCASIYDRKRCGILLHLFRCLGKQVRLKMLAGSTGAIGGATPPQSETI